MARTQPVLLTHYCLSTNFTNQKMPLSETAPINPTKMLMMSNGDYDHDNDASAQTLQTRRWFSVKHMMMNST